MQYNLFHNKSLYRKWQHLMMYNQVYIYTMIRGDCYIINIYLISLCAYNFLNWGFKYTQMKPCSIGLLQQNNCPFTLWKDAYFVSRVHTKCLHKHLLMTSNQHNALNCAKMKFMSAYWQADCHCFPGNIFSQFS